MDGGTIGLLGLCALLLLALCFSVGKLYRLGKGMKALGIQFQQRLEVDTNVGISLPTADPGLQALGDQIDRQLKLLRKAHIRYQQGDQELKEAIAAISHDLRTPLTALWGYLELLRREEVSPEVRTCLQVMEGRVEVLRQLTEELFCYCLTVTVRQYSSREPVCINEAVENCVAAQYALLISRGIAPEISLPEERIIRELHQEALSRILENVMSNAVKYSGGDLRIVLAGAGTLTFSNRAPGLDAVGVERLFDRFYTVETGRSATGLGLSIAKALSGHLGMGITARLRGEVLSIVLVFPQR